MLPRVQAFEFNDQTWLPSVLRDSFNDSLGFVHRLFQPHARAVEPIAAWAAEARVDTVLDLASAGGEHLVTLLNSARQLGQRLPKFVLSDLSPVPETWQALQDRFGADAVGAVDTPVSFFSLPDGLPRYWSIFTAVHHLRPEQVKQLLFEFSRRGDGLCIAEIFQRRWFDLLLTVFELPVNFIVPFLARKPTLLKLVLGTSVPIVPLMTCFDGVVSVLRTHHAKEIVDLLPAESRDQFSVESVTMRYGRAPLRASLVFITRKRPA